MSEQPVSEQPVSTEAAVADHDSTDDMELEPAADPDPDPDLDSSSDYEESAGKSSTGKRKAVQTPARHSKRRKVKYNYEFTRSGSVSPRSPVTDYSSSTDTASPQSSNATASPPKHPSPCSTPGTLYTGSSPEGSTGSSPEGSSPPDKFGSELLSDSDLLELEIPESTAVRKPIPFSAMLTEEEDLRKQCSEDDEDSEEDDEDSEDKSS